MQYREFIIDALQQASGMALGYFGKVTSTIKQDDNNQVLTEADIAIGREVISLISAAYPDHNIIDEEAGVIDRGSDFTWVVDPIDGTSNFAQGVPTYAIIIGLLHRGVPVAGGVALPAFSEICIAEKGKGAFCNGQRLSVSPESSLSSVLLAYGIDGKHKDPSATRDEAKLMGELVLNIRNLRASGSVFDGVMLAKGKYGGYLYRTSRIWDHVGMHIVIEEAGGVYTDFFGKPQDYKNPLKKVSENYTLCASTSSLHGQLQKIIHDSGLQDK